MDEPQAYLNGRFVPASRVSISPTDAGFVLGVTVAEQLRTFHGEIFRLDDHLARLEHSLEIVGVDPCMGRGRMAEVARKLVAGNRRLLDPGDDLGLSVFATPGTYAAYTSGREPPSPPTVCMHTYPLPFRLWAEKYRTGQSLRITCIEQVPPTSWPSALKCRSRMHYYLADRAAAAAEPQSRALLLDSEGRVTESSTANLVIYTPREGLISPQSHVLEGISLAQLWRLAAELGIPTVRRELTPEEVAAAEEAMLTSTPLCLLPVVRLDGQPIGDGRPGEVFGRLLAAWSDLVGLDIAGQAERFAQR